jgi:hypothetical protein
VDFLKTMLVNRATQLFARGLGLALVWLAATAQTTIDSAAAETTVQTLAALGAAGLAVLFDLAVHWYQDKKKASTPVADGNVVPLVLLCLLPLFAVGCGKRPAAVEQGHVMVRTAYLNVAENQQKILDAVIAGYRAAEYARIDADVTADLQEGARRAGPNSDTAQSVAFVQKIYAARDIRRADVDARVQRLRLIGEQARKDLLVAAKLDAALDQFDNTGIDLSAATKAVEQILQLGKSSNLLPSLQP